MPTLAPPARVLVTGANGFVGGWIVHRLLDGGYRVRAAVRSDDKARALSAFMGKKHPGSDSPGAFETVVVPDITVDGAFDECLNGIGGIIHTASPVSFAIEDPEAYFQPAIQGTLGILRSAAKHQSVKRVVFTSSIMAIAEAFTQPDKTCVCTEDDWNEGAVEAVNKLGREASGNAKYGASKVLSERAAWKFYEENKDTLPYELSVLAPAWSFGPLPDDPASPTELNGTARLQWECLFATPPPPAPYPAVFNYADIRDVADAHVRALEVEGAAGERMVVSSEVCTWQDWYDAASRMNLVPGLSDLHPPRAVHDSAEHDRPPHVIMRGEKATQKLGIVYKRIPETLQAVVDDFRARGWLREFGARTNGAA
ncbi:NAD-P-binding protein [Cubamyces sp. BRFM 1775]|nr:NAD-P-binding protein [Cubamyces sp. BRFM 1775]